MATCPKCFGALTDNHRCPSSLLRRVIDAITTVGIGGVAGAALCYVIDDQPTSALVISAAALGAVLSSAVRQAIGAGGPKPR